MSQPAPSPVPRLHHYVYGRISGFFLTYTLDNENYVVIEAVRGFASAVGFLSVNSSTARRRPQTGIAAMLAVVLEAPPRFPLLALAQFATLVTGLISPNRCDRPVEGSAFLAGALVCRAHAIVHSADRCAPPAGNVQSTICASVAPRKAQLCRHAVPPVAPRRLCHRFNG